jgi:hypothetical protein
VALSTSRRPAWRRTRTPRSTCRYDGRPPTCRRTTISSARARACWARGTGRSGLVTGVAQGLARLGRLPYLGELSLSHGGPTGGPGGNSAFRLAAVWERIVVGDELRERLGEAGSAPVLLVDDLADSRWTMTVAGRELRRAGAAGVLPFAVALTA